MKYPPFNVAIRLIHNIRYVKGQLIKRPLVLGHLSCPPDTENFPLSSGNVDSDFQVCCLHFVPGFTLHLVHLSGPLGRDFLLCAWSERQFIPPSVFCGRSSQQSMGPVISSKHLVKSLTCNYLDLSLLDLSPDPLHVEHSPSPVPPVEKPQLISQPAPGPQTLSTQRTPWLLAGMNLMGFNFYFPQLSPTFSL
ncbi:hypothetical protein DSO57_1007853 [Entomophthora muscae]|uniref:Uncharacterized protein n=1 Tax=Entomophthora muscae TaxID=34485 RepID=A0ACC2TUR0_9FUNG|nr:hypothetical protein DSO57_1007853 [Entomophthora muscae]